MKTSLTITGMTCGNCVKHVRQALLSVTGVTDAEVDLATGNATVIHEAADTASLIAAVVEEGYQAEVSA